LHGQDTEAGATRWDGPLKRWNHGLQQSLHRAAGVSSWSHPHLPTLSVLGLLKLREILSPDTMLLDLEVAGEFSLATLLDTVQERLEEREALPPRSPQFEISVRSEAPTRAFCDLAPSCGAWQHVPYELDLLCPDMPNEQDAALILAVVEPVDWLDKDLLVFVRLARPVDLHIPPCDVGTKFLALLFTPFPDNVQSQRETACALAAVLQVCHLSKTIACALNTIEIDPPTPMQDDQVADMCYRATQPTALVAQLKAHLHRMRVLPRVKWPTASGLAHRVTRLRNMMSEVTSTDSSQLMKWSLK
jgi:hypothetical protein